MNRVQKHKKHLRQPPQVLFTHSCDTLKASPLNPRLMCKMQHAHVQADPGSDEASQIEIIEKQAVNVEIIGAYASQVHLSLFILWQDDAVLEF